MIINDEPSPISRLRTETIKIAKLSLYKTRSYTKKYAYFVFIGFAAVAVGSLYLASSASSHEEKRIASIELQRYNACVFEKGISKDTNDNLAILDVDAECIAQDQPTNVAQVKEMNPFQDEISLMLEGYPMEEMAEFIAQEDKRVAGLIVGIARQESQWGKHAPSKGGVDCYNYWGYKTSGSRGQSLGYACFGSPQEAVETIAKRIDHFVFKTQRDTPAKMVTPWKCGNSCATHSPESVARWVGTVNTYYNQIVAMEIQDGSDITKSKYLSRK